MKDSLKVEQNEDGTFSLEWDPEDPKWSWLNDMNEHQIAEIISNYAQEVLDNSSLISDDSLIPDLDP